MVNDNAVFSWDGKDYFVSKYADGLNCDHIDSDWGTAQRLHEIYRRHNNYMETFPKVRSDKLSHF